MSRLRITAVTGNLRSPSRTVGLAQRIVQALQGEAQADVTWVDLGLIGAAIGGTLSRSALEGDAKTAIEAIETSDLLVVVTPVYRAAYTGLLKHLFDLVDGKALVGTPVILAANGADPQHSLVVEHLLRPLLGFFRAHPVPDSIYAEEKDFDARVVASLELEARIERAARSRWSRFAAQRTRSFARAPAAASLVHLLRGQQSHSVAVAALR
jgi:FMN reductase